MSLVVGIYLIFHWLLEFTLYVIGKCYLLDVSLDIVIGEQWWYLLLLLENIKVVYGYCYWSLEFILIVLLVIGKY